MDKSVYYIFASIFPLMVCSGIIYSIFALFIAEKGAPEAVVGFVFAISPASSAIAGPLFGKLSDKFGRRRILLVSMVIYFVAFLLYSVADNVLQVSLIQVLEGAAWAAEGAAATALVADMVPSRERGQAMGTYNMVWSIGYIVGPILGGVLAQLLGFKSMFMVCSGLLLLGLVMTLFLVKPQIRSNS